MTTPPPGGYPPPPGYPKLFAQPDTKRRNTVALIVAVLGLIAAPFVLLVSAVLLPVALVLGAVGLCLPGRSKATSAGVVVVAVIGVVVSGFAFMDLVRAVLLVARESVARNRAAPPSNKSSLRVVHRRFIERFDDYDRIVLSARGWALRPRSIEETAACLRVAKVNIHRNAPRSYLRFQDLLTEPWHSPVAQAAAALGLDLGSDAGQIVLHLAGPYRCNRAVAGGRRHVAGS